MSVFVSKDGDGTEVYVATAKGKITELEEKANAVNAKIKASYLDYPLNGWLNKDEPILEILRKAFVEGTEVEVRIESQRKKSIDRATPINELRANNPTKNIIKKLVAVNGVATGEALTNPADDPASGQATSALTSPRPQAEETGTGSVASVGKDAVLATLRSLASAREVSEGVLDAVKAQALIAGATAAEVIAASGIAPEGQRETVQSGFSKEAPSFKEFNSDGRLNLGGPAVGAAVGAYNYVFDKVRKQTAEEPSATVVEFYTNLMLAIADRIQVSSYGTGFRIDRSAGSHVRIRACIYTIIDAGIEFPVTGSGTLGTKESVNEFVQVVGKGARHNFLTGVKTSQQVINVGTLLASLDAPEDTATAVEPEPAAIESSPAVREPEVTEVTVVEEDDYSAPEPQYSLDPEEGAYEEVEPQQTYTSEPQSGIVTAPTPAETPAVATTIPENAPEGTEWFEQDLLPPGAISSSNAPTEETLDEFKSFIIEEVGLQTKAEQAKVAKLLAHTFGKAYSKASNVPEEKLGDFLDFYVATGAENFKTILASL